MSYYEKQQQRTLKHQGGNFFKAFKLFQDEYLWAPTFSYYIAGVAIFMVAQRRYSLSFPTFFLFMSLPLIADFTKREFYTIQHRTERDELFKRCKVVQKIMTEKKKTVGFQRVLGTFWKRNERSSN